VALVPGIKKADGTISAGPDHSWGLVFNKRSPSKDAAWKFLLYATGKEAVGSTGRTAEAPSGRPSSKIHWASGPYYS